MTALSVTEMEDFKARFGDLSNVYRVVFTLQQLNRIGVEYLAVNSPFTGRRYLAMRYLNGIVDHSFVPKLK